MPQPGKRSGESGERATARSIKAAYGDTANCCRFDDKDRIVSLREGNTPLLDAPGAAEYGGLDRLTFKHQGFNPTGSFKDNGMTCGVAQALRLESQARGVRFHREHVGIDGGVRERGRPGFDCLSSRTATFLMGSWRRRSNTAHARCK